MKSIFKRIWLNKKYIVGLATKLTGYLFAVIGFIGTFAPWEQLQNTELSIQHRLVISLIILIMTWMFFLFVSVFNFLLRRRLKLFEVSNGYSVYVQYGDIFSAREVVNPQERRNVVIPVNRCFDTIINNDLISEKTLHGITMKKLYSENRFTEESLNAEIQKSLSLQSINSVEISRQEKREGNLKRYNVGSVAEIKESEICTYFFLGLSTFDKDLHAHTSNDEYVVALMRLIEFCNARSQKYPVVIPLIGAGASETRKSESDILQYFIKLIKMNKELINCDLHIVVRDSGKETIAITGL